MKKLFAMLLAACLMFTAAAVCAEGDEIGVYTDTEPEAMAYVSTWVAENGDWRIEVYDEYGGIKLMVVHALGDSREDIWEYAAALNEEKDALVSVPTGLHYRQEIGTNDWEETYYEDGDADFTINEAGQLLWNDLKEKAGDGLKFDKIGNFFGGRWMKGDIEVDFYAWHDGEYDISLMQRGADGEILKTGLLKGAYDPKTDSVTADGSMDPDESLTVTFSYDENYNVVWTQNGESTAMEYSMQVD